MPAAIQVISYYKDAAGNTRGVWKTLPEVYEGTATGADALARELRDKYGAARIANEAFEVVALRSSVGLKLIEAGP